VTQSHLFYACIKESLIWANESLVLCVHQGVTHMSEWVICSMRASRSHSYERMSHAFNESRIQWVTHLTSHAHSSDSADTEWFIWVHQWVTHMREWVTHSMSHSMSHSHINDSADTEAYECIDESLIWANESRIQWVTLISDTLLTRSDSLIKWIIEYKSVDEILLIQ